MKMRGSPIWVLVMSITLVLLVPGGVRAGTTEDGLLAQVLLEKRSATRADCMAVAASFSGYQGDLVDIDAVLAHLEARGIHDEQETPHRGKAKRVEQRLAEGPLARPATRGFACLLLQRALPKPRSLMSRFFSRSEHYAYRYLQQRGAIPGGGASSRISGDELVGLWRHCRGLRSKDQ